MLDARCSGRDIYVYFTLLDPLTATSDAIAPIFSDEKSTVCNIILDFRQKVLC